MVEISDMRDYRFTREDLEKASEELLRFFDSRKINSIGSLEKMADNLFDLGESKIRIVAEDMEGSNVYIINYEIPVLGTPISLSIDPDANYFLISVESIHVIPEYIDTGNFTLSGNIIQYKEVEISSPPDVFPDIREELRVLMG